jgi:hypothetical protein
MERASVGPVDVQTPARERIAINPTSKARIEHVVNLDKRMRESMDAHVSFEHVEEHDVHRRKARDERAADAILLLGELASE